MLGGCADSTIVIAWWRCGSRFLADRVEFDDLRPIERRLQRLQREVGARTSAFRSRRSRRRASQPSASFTGSRSSANFSTAYLCARATSACACLRTLSVSARRAQERVAKAGDFRLGLLEQVRQVGSGSAGAASVDSVPLDDEAHHQPKRPAGRANSGR